MGSAFLPDAGRPPFRDPAHPQVKRVDDLLQRKRWWVARERPVSRHAAPMPT
ncbi:hypothetical protein [Streptomyces sp. NBC_01530]|uniref:hypothetical protein n=1 Tax=Streptomyces sp. NBC_01530 TaxID=2903895 RepID=UPI003868AFD1